MSKVKSYIDTKHKARHRQRRYETAHKKEIRIRNARMGVYYYWGYYHEEEHYTYRYERLEQAEGYYSWNQIDWDVYYKTGEVIYNTQKANSNRKVFIPAHVANRTVEERVIPVSIVKRINKNAKELKKTAARKFRRQKVDEDSPAFSGSIYKKDFEMQWMLL